MVACEDECGEIDSSTLSALLELGHACENAHLYEVALEVRRLAHLALSVPIRGQIVGHLQ